MAARGNRWRVHNTPGDLPPMMILTAGRTRASRYRCAGPVPLVERTSTFIHEDGLHGASYLAPWLTGVRCVRPRISEPLSSREEIPAASFPAFSRSFSSLADSAPRDVRAAGQDEFFHRPVAPCAGTTMRWSKKRAYRPAGGTTRSAAVTNWQARQPVGLLLRPDWFVPFPGMPAPGA